MPLPAEEFSFQGEETPGAFCSLRANGEEKDMSILIVTGIEGAQNCAKAVAGELGLEFEVAEGRKQALAYLRQREFAVVVVDESIVECDPAGADSIWQRAGLAIPLQINFAIAGAARLAREIRSALHRREREQMLAHRAAAAAIESELKTTLTGLLLQSQLALSCSEASSPLTEKLRIVADLAGSLRRQLSATISAGHETVV
jgi:signal transduction histidine kinase